MPTQNSILLWTENLRLFGLTLKLLESSREQSSLFFIILGCKTNVEFLLFFQMFAVSELQLQQSCSPSLIIVKLVEVEAVYQFATASIQVVLVLGNLYCLLEQHGVICIHKHAFCHCQYLSQQYYHLCSSMRVTISTRHFVDTSGG